MAFTQPQDLTTSGPDRQQTAVGKVVAVLEALTREHRVSDIANIAEIPLSTAHRILNELSSYGWVSKTGDHHYELGPCFTALLFRPSATANFVRLSMPVLARLRETTTCTVHLSLFRGDAMIWIAKLDSNTVYQMRSQIGESVPLHSTASGKAVLSALPPNRVNELLRQLDLKPYTANTLTDPNQLLTDLIITRDRGVAMDNEENEPGVRCIATPIITCDGSPIAAVSVSFLRHDITSRSTAKIAALIKSAGRTLSNTIRSTRSY